MSLYFDYSYMFISNLFVIFLIDKDLLFFIMYLINNSITFAMRPPKREITKPTRYQTTESSDDNEDLIMEKYELTRDEVQNEVESDVHALSKVLVETQKILENKDGESNTLTLNHGQSSKPSIRCNVILNSPFKHRKASASYNEPSISKQYDKSHSNVSYNDHMASTSSTVTSNAQYEPRNLRLTSVYQSESHRGDKLHTIIERREKIQNVDNQHYDYLNNKR